MDSPIVYDPISRNENLDETVLDLVQPGLTVIVGPMFASKSRKLIDAIDSVGVRLNKVKDSLRDPGSFSLSDYVAAFVPQNDTRSKDAITSRGSLDTEISYPATVIPPTEPWRMLEEQYHGNPFVFIDEGNFYGDFSQEGVFRAPSGLKPTVQMLVEQGREVYVAGLSADFRGEPFAEMGGLLAIADTIIKVNAREGKNPNATRTQRIINGRPAQFTDPVFLVGDRESYEPRIVENHRVPGKRKYLASIIDSLME